MVMRWSVTPCTYDFQDILVISSKATEYIPVEYFLTNVVTGRTAGNLVSSTDSFTTLIFFILY